MATSQINGVIQHLRSILQDGVGLTDGQLLEDYISRRDDASFAALVRRHGPMVRGVCRRVLRDHHAAEDAFQATFLVFVRRAASIASRELLANWLYGVAHQTALKARTTAAKRKERERQVTEMPETAVTQRDQWPDLQPVLDEELSRLPDKYRGVIILCDLEGRTRKEAAGQLGCAEGTVASRLARARIMLAKRLTNRGVAFSGGALAAVLSEQVVSAGVPNSVVVSTIKAATLFAAGEAAVTGVISVKVAALTEGVMKAMLFNKLKAAIAVLLILGFVATGTTFLTCRTAAGQEEKKPIAEKPVEAAQKQEKEKDKGIVIAWGKEVGGLQAGLGFKPGEKRAYSPRETVKLVVRVRNVGKEEVKFHYCRETFFETPPTVTDSKGKPIPLERDRAYGFAALVPANLLPGKEIEVGERELELKPTSYRTGKYSVLYEQLETPENDKSLSKLATGKLELEVKDAEKLPEKKEKDGFIAWGKEVGGLQAGLGFRPSEDRAYRHGETATLVVRVRNVGKEVVKVSYLQPFIEHSPTVTDSDGKPVPQPNVIPDLGERDAGVVELPPGKEIDLHEMKRELKPASESGSKQRRAEGRPYALYGTGKVSVQYEQVLGMPEMGRPKWKLDPALSKLATGKLELEIKSEMHKPINPETIAAYKKLGAVHGVFVGDHFGWVNFLPGTEATAKGRPGFSFYSLQDEFKLPKLPPVQVPFGLSLADTKVTDADLRELKDLKNLTSLVLSGTRITDAGLNSLKNLKSLATLNLAETSVTNAGLKELKDLKNLISLDLRTTQVTDEGLKELKGLENLIALDLTATQVTDEGLKNIKGFKNLISLYLPLTQVTDAGLKELKDLKTLTSLSLTGTEVTDVGLKELKGLENLTTLRLGSTHVTDAGLKDLKDLKNLISLELAKTTVTDEGLKELRDLKYLGWVNLSNTKVTKSGVEQLTNALPGCQIVGFK